VLPSTQQVTPHRWPSHNDHARKALAKLAGPHLPATLKQLEKAIAKAHGGYERAQQDARPKPAPVVESDGQATPTTVTTSSTSPTITQWTTRWTVTLSIRVARSAPTGSCTQTPTRGCRCRAQPARERGETGIQPWSSLSPPPVRLRAGCGSRALAGVGSLPPGGREGVQPREAWLVLLAVQAEEGPGPRGPVGRASCSSA
jgi:hypothetical protein